MPNPLNTILRRAARLLRLRTGLQRRPSTFGFPGSATSSLPGFPPPPTGTFDTYRRMSAHPTIALARSIVVSPIAHNQWDFVKHPSAPQSWLDFTRDTINPLRPQIIRDALRALDFGFFPAEIIWQRKGARLTISNLKPLLPDLTTILTDAQGNFAALRNQSEDNQPVTLQVDEAKAFLWSYDAEAGNLYGRSRHENIRDRAWSPSLQVSDRLAQYLKKIAGLVIQLHYPEGTSRDQSGAERSNDFLAQQILDAVSAGRSVRLPNLFASVAADAADPRSLESAAALAGKSQWVLSSFDAANSDHAAGLLKTLEYLDKLMFRGWLRPERVGLESEHAARADAAVHTNTGLLDSALIDADLAHAVTQGLINPLLELNFGPQAKNSIRISPNPLNDDSAQTNLRVIQSLLANPQTSPTVASRIDINALLTDLALPLVQQTN